MALIEVFHVVADHYPVDPEYTGEIIEGQAVTLDANGYVAPTDAGDFVVGIAGDSISTAGNTEWSAQVTINPAGAQRYTQNRVANQGDETLASGRLTVYTSGGKFRSDQYDTTQTYAPGDTLYAGATGLLTSDAGGAANAVVGLVVEGPLAFPSGVPGTDIDGSMSLGTFVTFILNIDNG